ncbi:MAG: TolC family outer membrane protein [Proteobacteria bacterium]|nr:TolC family outer membrane protein [Pseudomonadota bacterium]
MNSWLRHTATAAIALAIGFAGAPAGAQTLEDALASTYKSNPELLAQRAALRAVDEQVPRALSQWRPTVQVTGNAGPARDYNATTSTVYGANQSRDRQTIENQRVRQQGLASLQLVQPLYRGGRSTAELARAEANIQSSRALLSATEQRVLLDAATAYINLARELAVLDLNVNNVQVLQRQLDAARDRFQVGEITRTDVSQAEARLAQAQATRTGSEGNVNSARATYLRVVGEEAGRLAVPPVPGNLPGSDDEARNLALTANPTVSQARYAHESAGQDVSLIEGEKLPTVNLQADAIRSIDPAGSKGLQRDTVDLLLAVTVPIYQQGLTDARVREAKQTQGQRRTQIDVSQRQVIDDANRAWQQLTTARAQILSFEAQIRANEIALEGVSQEARVGSRTVLDVLNAEQELLNSRVSLVQAQRDQVLAAFQLLSATGRLTASNLALKVDLYDPTAYLESTRNRWIGTDIPGEAPKP